MQQWRGDALWYPLQFVLFGHDVELNGMGLAVRCVMHSSPTLALVYALARDAPVGGPNLPLRNNCCLAGPYCMELG
jgi:hypothetical protein